MRERTLEFDNTVIRIEREAPRPDWLDCTEGQWEKKSELALRSNDFGSALKFADYANCRALYDEGLTIKEIQSRFDGI